MWREVFLDAWRSGLRATLWWALGLAAYAALTWAFYPTVRDNPDIGKFIERLPEAVRVAFGAQDFLSPGGYAWARMFSLVVPLTLIIFGIRAGTRAIAGDEEAGRLELILAQPVTRAGVLMGRALAVGALLAVLGAALFVTSLLGARAVNAAIDAADLAAACALVTLLAWALGALALAVGAATGRAGLAGGVAFAVTLAGYLVHSLAPQVPALRDVRGVTPFWYALGESPFKTHVPVTNGLALALAGAILVLLAYTAFRRRDIAK